MRGNLFKKTVAAAIILSLLQGCSTHSENIGASYVSPLEYHDHTCRQIRQELVRVNRKVLDVSGKQDREATKDAVAFGVGMLLFWPALFFMIGDDKKEELARLKGEYEALENTAIEKNCDVAREIEVVRKQQEQYRREKDSGSDTTTDEPGI